MYRLVSIRNNSVTTEFTRPRIIIPILAKISHKGLIVMLMYTSITDMPLTSSYNPIKL